ncbi:hypothetical protein FRX31_029662 [Thalictrum thalictroides]|uniref:RNase H type-1 domain-containing protein n=1 Tax=Thalictrum thalictroides TaxID=46969 RepID=A0A7J6V722_THATH|nr:hypothetical protein FRX31_029662 [Thalictrum thalictroides]
MANFFSYYGNGTNNEAESRAIMEGISLCKSLGYHNILILTDSNLCFKWFYKLFKIPWPLRVWWKRIWDIAATCQVTVEHTYREGNKAADHLASLGIKHKGDGAANCHVDINFKQFLVGIEDAFSVNADSEVMPDSSMTDANGDDSDKQAAEKIPEDNGLFGEVSNHKAPANGTINIQDLETKVSSYYSLQAQFPLIYTISLAKNSTISALRTISEGEGVWDLRLRRNRFEWEDEHFRHLMTLLTGYVVEEGDDMWRWKEGNHGVFSVRSMYKLLREQSSMHNQVTNVTFPASLIWNQNMPAKVKFFFWTVMHNRTLTVDNLIRRGSLLSPVCSPCGCINESITHLFLHCTVSLRIWKEMTIPVAATYQQLFAVDSVLLWLQNWKGGHQQEWAARLWKLLPYATIWIIWKARNSKIFKGKELKVDKVCNEIKATLWFWCANWGGRKRFRFRDLIINWEQVIRGQIEPE